MLIAIDTCGALGGVALGQPLSARDSRSQDRGLGQTAEIRIVASRELAGKTYSELLLSTISDMLRDADVALDQLSGIVVVRGPGSFTGIRIGVSAAKGLAEGLAIPVDGAFAAGIVGRQSSGPECGCSPGCRPR